MIKYCLWESRFFGFDIYLLEKQDLRNNNLENILKDFQKKTLIRSVHIKDKVFENYLSNLGFINVDDGLEFDICLNDKKLKDQDNINIKEPYYFEKLSNIHTISFRSFSTKFFNKSKYYFDKNFDSKLADKMYLEWFTKSINGEFDDEIIGITKGKNIIAFSSLKKICSKECKIGLFGVNPKYFQNGFGKLMLENLIVYIKKNNFIKIKVKTQNRNVGAQKLYLSSNFQIRRKITTMHLWLNSK